MKILMVSEFFPTGKDLRFSGGVETRNYQVARHLSKTHKVTILTNRIEGTRAYEKIGRVDIVRVGKPGKYNAAAGGLIKRFGFIINAISKSKDIDADIVEGTNFISHLITLQIAKAKNIPSVAWYPDVWIGQWLKNAGFVGIFGEILERFNLKLGFSSYIAISKQTADKLKKHTSAKINIIPCGVDPKEFSIRRKKENRIICVSRLVKYKRVKDLILAYARVQKQNKELTLLIVGRGPEEKNLKDLVKNLHLYSKVIFKSNLTRKDLAGAIKSSKLMCIPSEVEGFGISLIEAAAAAIPFVASDISVFKEITKNGKGGLHFELGNLSDLALKIEKLLNNKTLYAKKVKETSVLIKSYKWQKIAASTEQIYKHLV